MPMLLPLFADDITDADYAADELIIEPLPRYIILIVSLRFTLIIFIVAITKTPPLPPPCRQPPRQPMISAMFSEPPRI